MKEKVLELLVYLMSEIRDNKPLADVDLSSLQSRGYTTSEISDAFGWLHEHVPPPAARAKRPATAGGLSRRMFHEAEKLVLSTEGQGYLILLSELGLLSDEDLEAVIERAMMAGYEKLSVAELRQLAAAVLTARRVDRAPDRPVADGGDTVH